MSRDAIPVTIVTGFLGAGKSTLLQHWLEQLPRNETAVIVNERGEVGIDGELLAAHVARLREITGGCICCRSQAELSSALVELGETQPRPGRILVETSGAASPAGVIRAITSNPNERFCLDGVVTVVDVTRIEAALEFDLAVEQLGFADVVVLTHVDRLANAASELTVDEIEQRLRIYAPTAVTARSSNGTMSFELLDLLAQRTEALHVPPSGTGHSSIQAVSLVVDGELDEESFGDWVQNVLGGVQSRILRVKGILAIQGVDVRVIVHGVGDAVEVELGRRWVGAARSSRLVVLGLGLNAAELESTFRRCVASEP